MNVITSYPSPDESKALDRNRFVWVFERIHPPKNGSEQWVFMEYFMTEYNTQWHDEARRIAEYEYGYSIRGSQRRELTFPEYCAVLRCNNEGEHNRKVWQAMLAIIFTGEISCVRTRHTAPTTRPASAESIV